MHAQAVNDPRREVMIFVNGAAVHAYITAQLDKRDAHGDPLFLARDDSGIVHMVSGKHIRRITTDPILNAERHIQTVQRRLAVIASDGLEEVVFACMQELDEALYELSKPEATSPN